MLDVDPLAEMRALLPTWTLWLGVAIAGPLAFLATFVTGRIGLAFYARKLRGSEELHWTERARRLHGARMWLAYVALTVVIAILYAHLVSPLELGDPFAGLRTLAALVGCELALVALVLVFARRLPFCARDSRTARSICATWILRRGMIAAIVVLLLVLPDRPEWRSLAWALPLTAVGVTIAYGFAPPVLARLGLAIEIEPPPELAGRGVRLFVVDFVGANAFAYPLARTIAITRDAYALLAPGERATILAHELAHLDEPIWLYALRITAPAALIATPWVRAWFGTDHPATAIVALAAVAVSIGVRSAARGAESRADCAAGVTDSAAYVRALEKLHEHGLRPVRSRARKGHPDLVDRIRAAGHEPAWPEPAPAAPSPRLARFGTVLLFLPVLGLSGINRWESALPTGGDADRLRIALGIGRCAPLGRWAREEFTAGDFERSRIVYAACEELDPLEPTWPSDVAVVLARLGRCDEARDEADEAARRSRGRHRAPDAVAAARRAVEWCEQRGH